MNLLKKNLKYVILLTSSILIPKTWFAVEGSAFEETFVCRTFLGAVFLALESDKSDAFDNINFKKVGGIGMETRIAVIGIVVEDEKSVEILNEILHEYRYFIIGRMGIPYPRKEVSVISIAVDAPQTTISALTGKIGKVDGISSKTAYQSIKKGD